MRRRRQTLGKPPLYFYLVSTSPLARSATASKLGFSGHETFPFRYGWLPKAVMGAENAHYFSQPLALVDLGVGKNMVQSIRHWGVATGLLHDGTRGEVRRSDLGDALFERWDTYLEDIGSLWLVHWQLVNNPIKAAAWYYTFFEYPRRDFNKAELVQQLSDWAERAGAKNKSSTLERDVDCLIRTYLPSKASKSGVAEDSFDCPLVELGLLQQYEDGQRYAFVYGAKRTLPTGIFAYALLDFIERNKGGTQTVPLHDLLFGAGSPGQAFKLDENALMEKVEAVQALTNGAIDLDDTAGLKQVYLRRKVDKWEMLEQFYGGQA